MKNKVDVLKKLATLLNNNDVTWNVGASCMLFLRGMITTFDDIDIMVHLDDVKTVMKLLSDYKMLERKPSEDYKTKYFFEFVIEDVDIDIIAGFNIINNGKEHYFPLERNSKFDQIVIDDTIIYLESVEKWLEYYKLMEREDKVDIISQKTGLR